MILSNFLPLMRNSSAGLCCTAFIGKRPFDDRCLKSVSPAYVLSTEFGTLCALHSLDVTDKHRLLIPIASVTALTNLNARIGGMTFVNCALTVGNGGVINIASMPEGDLYIEGYGTPER